MREARQARQRSDKPRHERDDPPLQPDLRRETRALGKKPEACPDVIFAPRASMYLVHADSLLFYSDNFCLLRPTSPIIESNMGYLR